MEPTDEHFPDTTTLIARLSAALDDAPGLGLL
jgi:hypothetical protein